MGFFTGHEGLHDLERMHTYRHHAGGGHDHHDDKHHHHHHHPHAHHLKQMTHDKHGRPKPSGSFHHQWGHGSGMSKSN